MNIHKIPEQPPPKYDEKSLAEPDDSKTLEEVIVIEEAPRLSRNERAIREQIEISGVSDQREFRCCCYCCLIACIVSLIAYIVSLFSK